MEEILDIINAETGFEFQTILVAIAIYITTVWLLFSLWVFLDARKRFGSYPVAILVSFMVFVLNFPALIFYLIARPEDLQEESEQEVMAVPLANFLDEKGNVAMTINLNLSKLTAEVGGERTLDINKQLDTSSANNRKASVKEDSKEAKNNNKKKSRITPRKFSEMKKLFSLDMLKQKKKKSTSKLQSVQEPLNNKSENSQENKETPLKNVEEVNTTTEKDIKSTENKETIDNKDSSKPIQKSKKKKKNKKN